MFRPSIRRRLFAAALLAGATSFQMAGCAAYWEEALVSAFDFCSILNCTGSTFFDFCGSNSLLLDCPDLQTQ